MKQRNGLLFMLGVVAALSAQAQTAPAPAPAQQPAAPATDWQAAIKSMSESCKGDMPQLCPGLSVDTAMACLQTNMDKLTPACKDAVTKLAKSLSF